MRTAVAVAEVGRDVVVVRLLMVGGMPVFRDLGAWARDDVHLLELGTDLLAARAEQAEKLKTESERK